MIIWSCNSSYDAYASLTQNFVQILPQTNDEWLTILDVRLHLRRTRYRPANRTICHWYASDAQTITMIFSCTWTPLVAISLTLTTNCCHHHMLSEWWTLRKIIKPFTRCWWGRNGGDANLGNHWQRACEQVEISNGFDSKLFLRQTRRRWPWIEGEGLTHHVSKRKGSHLVISLTLAVKFLHCSKSFEAQIWSEASSWAIFWSLNS
jgi:hypothetical protein